MFGLFVAVAQKPLQRSQEGQQRGLVGVKDAARFLPVAAVAVQFERDDQVARASVENITRNPPNRARYPILRS